MSVSTFFKVDVGFGFPNYRDIGVGVDFLTNIALQGKSIRPYNVRDQLHAYE